MMCVGVAGGNPAQSPKPLLLMAVWIRRALRGNIRPALQCCNAALLGPTQIAAVAILLQAHNTLTYYTSSGFGLI
jgi:hypothetical protein